MSLTTPTTSELSAQIVAQLEASLQQAVPLLPKAFLRVLAKVLSAAVVLVYRYAGQLHLDQFVRYASFSETTVNGRTFRPLVEHGIELNVGEPTDAVPAQLILTVTVSNQTGSLPAGSQLLHSDTGLIFQTLANRLLDASTVDVEVVASSIQGGGDGAGEIGNLPAGTELEFANPLPNVVRTAVVASTSVYGAEAEAEAEYRSRVLSRKQMPPQGGARADYRLWGSEAIGVVQIYPYTGLAGEMDIYVEVHPAADPDGIPNAYYLSAAQTLIEYDTNGFANRRPANCKINVLPITRTAYSVEIKGLDVAADQVATVKSAIEAGVDEWLRSREPFIVGLSVLPRRDRITQGAIAGVATEIASSYGATLAAVTLLLGVNPIPSDTLTGGRLAKLSTPITWT